MVMHVITTLCDCLCRYLNLNFYSPYLYKHVSPTSLPQKQTLHTEITLASYVDMAERK